MGRMNLIAQCQSAPIENVGVMITINMSLRKIDVTQETCAMNVVIFAVIAFHDILAITHLAIIAVLVRLALFLLMAKAASLIDMKAEGFYWSVLVVVI